MATLALLTDDPAGVDAVLPALRVLPHDVRVLPADLARLAGSGAPLAVVDARADLATARALCRAIGDALPDVPALAVFRPDGLVAVSPEWRLADFVLTGACPAEVDARLRVALDRAAAAASAPSHPASSSASGGPEGASAGELVVDEDAWTARLRGRPLDLTFKEFELLRHLAAHPGRVFTRAQLLHDVWGSDYYGGVRTVDVHVRRLRAKLGPDHETLIGTVRNVGYRFVPRDTAPAG